MQAINPDNCVQYPHRLYPGLPFCAAKERVRRSPGHSPTAPRPIPRARQLVYPAIQDEQFLHGLCVFARQPEPRCRPRQPCAIDSRTFRSRFPACRCDAFRPAGRLALEFTDYRQPRVWRTAGSGFILPDRRHRHLHPVAPRCGRLRREPTAATQPTTHARRLPINSGSGSTRSSRYLYSNYSPLTTSIGTGSAHQLPPPPTSPRCSIPI